MVDMNVILGTVFVVASCAGRPDCQVSDAGGRVAWPAPEGPSHSDAVEGYARLLRAALSSLTAVATPLCLGDLRPMPNGWPTARWDA
jgi:hypothetical protein